MTHGTFVSFASLETGKAIGAVLLAGRVDVRSYLVDDTTFESIDTGRFYTTDELEKEGYEKGVIG